MNEQNSNSTFTGSIHVSALPDLQLF